MAPKKGLDGTQEWMRARRLGSPAPSSMPPLRSGQSKIDRDINNQAGIRRHTKETKPKPLNRWKTNSTALDVFLKPPAEKKKTREIQEKAIKAPLKISGRPQQFVWRRPSLRATICGLYPPSHRQQATPRRQGTITRDDGAIASRFCVFTCTLLLERPCTQ